MSYRLTQKAAAQHHNQEHEMTQFNTTIYILDRDGGEHEIPVEVDYDCDYEPEYITGLPENCYPASGELTLNSIEPVGEWPPGITPDMVDEDTKEKVEQEAWEHYFSKGVDDDE